MADNSGGSDTADRDNCSLQNGHVETLEAEEVVEETQEQSVRQQTQTDHLNKRLLQSFLDRLNTTELITSAQSDPNMCVDSFDDEPDDRQPHN